jgi:hypothetical protein
MCILKTDGCKLHSLRQSVKALNYTKTEAQSKSRRWKLLPSTIKENETKQ